MNFSERIKAFTFLGVEIDNYLKQSNSGTFDLRFEDLNHAVENSFHYNGWFTKEEVLRALSGISSFLKEDELTQWTQAYQAKIEEQKSLNVGIIMAGNIPLVGFHDLLSVIICGHSAQVKLSSNDNVLLPSLLSLLSEAYPSLIAKVNFVERLKDFDAVVATGSNNSARYFESYFSKVPNIIRKNRTSIAVLNGDETPKELEELASDIFHYYGLGCRNVSKVYIPEQFELKRIFEAMLPFQYVLENKKYANNYNYNRTMYLMNSERFLDNDFVIIKEDKGHHSPLGVLFVERYEDIHKLEEELTKLSDNLQCVVGREGIPCGNSQSPKLWDYADGINTMEFLTIGINQIVE